MLIDSHCHLDFPDFAADRDAVIARAKARGISRMITISTRVRSLNVIPIFSAQ
jgi:TatD DNase family protein